jgi:hypothetical protein
VQPDDGHHEGPKHVVVVSPTPLAIKVYVVVFMTVFHIHFLKHVILLHFQVNRSDEYKINPLIHCNSEID